MNNNELENFRINYSRLVSSKNRGSAESRENDLYQAIRDTYIDEENSNHILCFVGAFIRTKNVINEGDTLSYNDNKSYRDTLTYDDNYNYTFRRYIDIETDQIYDVQKDSVKEFEGSHIIIKPKVIMNNLHEYNREFLRIKKQFFKSLVDKPQAEVLKLVRNQEIN